MTTDPLKVGAAIQDALMTHVESDTWFRSEALTRERRALLRDGRSLMQDVLLEPVLPYDGTHHGHDVLQDVGLSEAEADLLLASLFHVGDAGSSSSAPTRQKRSARPSPGVDNTIPS